MKFEDKKITLTEEEKETFRKAFYLIEEIFSDAPYSERFTIYCKERPFLTDVELATLSHNLDYMSTYKMRIEQEDS